MSLTKTALLAAAFVVAIPAVSAAPKSKAPAPAAQVQVPDITGIWEMWPDPFAHGEDNVFLELPVPGDGPKLKEPYASQWKAKRELRTKMLEAGTPLPDPSTLCMPEGMPSIMGAIFALEFLQTPKQITVLGEFLTQTRRIYMNEEMPALEDLTLGYYGHSVGKWEGDTLVVTTIGVQPETEFFEIPHSANMKITERIRLTAPNIMENQVTIEDPDMLVEPYKFSFGYKKNPEYRIVEYFCEKEDPLLKFNKDGTIEMKTEEDMK